ERSTPEQQDEPARENSPATEERDLAIDLPDHWTYPEGIERSKKDPSEDWVSRSYLLVSLGKSITRKFASGYPDDHFFKERYLEVVPNANSVLTPGHYQKGKDGLLYFLDADWIPRLCVPKSMISFILKSIHENAYEMAHAGPK
ncbi:hypothetical protein PLICRDRAFT_85536, partial [Plicaturopsis crispa FD-325 SS-3]